MHQQHSTPIQRHLKWLLLAYSLFGNQHHVHSFSSSKPFHSRNLRLKQSKSSRRSPSSYQHLPISKRKRWQNRLGRWSPSLSPRRRTTTSQYVASAALSEQEFVNWEHVLAPRECGLDEEENDHDTPCVVPDRPHPQMTVVDRTVIGGSVAAAATFLTYLVTASGDWRCYLAGGICAAVSHLVPVPVDVVKTRKQVDPSLAQCNMAQATRRICQAEGWRALFVGSGPTFWGYFLEGALKFGVYEALKPTVQAMLLPMAHYSVALSKYVAFGLSAAISGLAASIMLCPMESLRIRLVAEPEYASLGWVRGASAMMQREGVSAFGKGLLPMIYKQVPYTITKNVSFDIFTKLAYASLLARTAMMTSTTRLAIPLASAAMASVLACISSQPGDMLLSLVNAHGGSRRTHDVARDIWRSDRGVRGFFVGIQTRFLHVGIIVTMQLLIYDFVKQLCGIAATGSV